MSYKMITRIRPSQFISTEPTRQEIIFMLQWLYNMNKRKGDFERCEELKAKIDRVERAERVGTSIIEGGIPALAGGVAGQIPNVNYKIVKGKVIMIESKTAIPISELLESGRKFEKIRLDNERMV